ncbi:MAG: serine/threonine protein kinase [Myxococcales bacterium]|nr:serine/threonine protein kinase [Myxococcales bacterium]
MKRTLTLAIAALALAASLPACGRGFDIHTPAGFAELEGQKDYGYRATTAEGVVMAVRRKPNAPFGDLGFWSGAIDAQLRRNGYTAVEGRDLKSADGTDGKRIHYSRILDGRTHALWLAVFVNDDHVYTVEAGGDAEFFEKAAPSVDTALASLELH